VEPVGGCGFFLVMKDQVDDGGLKGVVAAGRDEDVLGLSLSLSDEQLVAMKSARGKFLEDSLRMDNSDGREHHAAVVRSTLGTLFPAANMDLSLFEMTTLTGSGGKGGKLSKLALAGREADSCSVQCDSWDVEPVDDSWEELDETSLALQVPVGSESVHVPEEEEEEGEMLDAPMLIVNTTLYRDSCNIAADKSNESVELDICEMLAMAGDSFESRCEVMFEHKLLYHSSVESIEGDVNTLHGLFGTGVHFACVPYPASMYDARCLELRRTSDIWRDIIAYVDDSVTSEFECVDRIKQWILSCSRTLLWKLQILEELRHVVCTEELDLLGRIEVVERIKDLQVLERELVKLIQDDAENDLLNAYEDKLDNIRKTIEDAKKELALIELELKDTNERKELSIVDLILAMVFQRCDLERRPFESIAAFQARIGEIHMGITSCWKREFGKLPFLAAETQVDSGDDEKRFLAAETQVDSGDDEKSKKKKKKKKKARKQKKLDKLSKAFDEIGFTL